MAVGNADRSDQWILARVRHGADVREHRARSHVRSDLAQVHVPPRRHDRPKHARCGPVDLLHAVPSYAEPVRVNSAIAFGGHALRAVLAAGVVLCILGLVCQRVLGKCQQQVQFHRGAFIRHPSTHQKGPSWRNSPRDSPLRPLRQRARAPF